jgi:ABC-2 type transport system ATP-binding protein
MLTTTVAPTSGSARVAGFDVASRPLAARRVSAVVFQDAAVDRSLTGRRNLDIHARLWSVDPATAAARIGELAQTLALGQLLQRPVATYSGGERRRLEIARALVSRPQVLFLDEPTAGLDPQTRVNLWDTLRALHAEGQTILLTTHYMEEADQLCDRVAIIDHGEIVALDTPAALKRRIRAEEVVTLEIGMVGEDAPMLARLANSAVIARSERHNGTLAVTAHCASARDFVPAAFDAARSEGATIQHVEVVPVSLEDVFISLTGRALRE